MTDTHPEKDPWGFFLTKEPQPLAAYRQLGKPMFKEVMKEVCHEGTYGFYRKAN
jgi:hypothetical protein